MSQEPLRGEIVPSREPELVAPADMERVIGVMQKFQTFKSKVLDRDDWVEIAGRSYIKKSGWLKYALACGISLEKREERIEDQDEGKVRIYHYTYRAIAPNGRYADAVGSASTEEREWAHEEHDVRALAQTRSCNRAISNLVAGGEVSAEEMVGTERMRPRSPPPPRPAAPATTPPPRVGEERVWEGAPPQRAGWPEARPAGLTATEPVMIRFVKDAPFTLMGAGGKEYGPFNAEDVASIPRVNALNLIQQGYAKEIVPREEERKVTPSPKEGEEVWVDLKETKEGVEYIYGSIKMKGNEGEIVPSSPINPTLGCVQRPLLQVLDGKSRKHEGFMYYPETDSEGRLMRIQLFGVTQEIIKDLVSPARWSISTALKKASEET